EALEPRWWGAQLHSTDAGNAMEGLHVALREGTSRVEYRIKHRDGYYLWLEDRKRLLSPPGEEPREIVGGWTDITARKQAEQAAREIEARFRQVVENIHEVFWMVD